MNRLFSHQPKLSKFVRKMVKEDIKWVNQVAEYNAAPARGIRGIGSYRKADYVDYDLQALYANARDNYVEPVTYLRSIANHL